MSAPQQTRLDSADVAALYVQYGQQLNRFLLGLLRDSQLAGDVLQATFTKMVEQGHTTQPESRKAWLFRVAYNEAMAVRRRDAVGDRVLRHLASGPGHDGDSAADPLIRLEAVEAVRKAIDDLPPAQRVIVRLRIYEDKTFAVIAKELDIPLGTALGRMRAAMTKLRNALAEE